MGSGLDASRRPGMTTRAMTSLTVAAAQIECRPGDIDSEPLAASRGDPRGAGRWHRPPRFPRAVAHGLSLRARSAASRPIAGCTRAPGAGGRCRQHARLVRLHRGRRRALPQQPGPGLAGPRAARPSQAQPADLRPARRGAALRQGRAHRPGPAWRMVARHPHLRRDLEPGAALARGAARREPAPRAGRVVAACRRRSRQPRRLDGESLPYGADLRAAAGDGEPLRRARRP